MNSDKTDIEKLLEDGTFRNWVLRSDRDDFERWETLLNRDKELARSAEEARSIVLMAELEDEGLSEEENKEALRRLMDRIDAVDFPPALKQAKKR